MQSTLYSENNIQLRAISDEPLDTGKNEHSNTSESNEATYSLLTKLRLSAHRTGVRLSPRVSETYKSIRRHIDRAVNWSFTRVEQLTQIPPDKAMVYRMQLAKALGLCATVAKFSTIPLFFIGLAIAPVKAVVIPVALAGLGASMISRSIARSAARGIIDSTNQPITNLQDAYKLTNYMKLSGQKYLRINHTVVSRTQLLIEIWKQLDSQPNSNGQGKKDIEAQLRNILFNKVRSDNFKTLCLGRPKLSADYQLSTTQIKPLMGLLQFDELLPMKATKEQPKGIIDYLESEGYSSLKKIKPINESIERLASCNYTQAEDYCNLLMAHNNLPCNDTSDKTNQLLSLTNRETAYLAKQHIGQDHVTNIIHLSARETAIRTFESLSTEEQQQLCGETLMDDKLLKIEAAIKQHVMLHCDLYHPDETLTPRERKIEIAKQPVTILVDWLRAHPSSE